MDTARRIFEIAVILAISAFMLLRGADYYMSMSTVIGFIALFNYWRRERPENLGLTSKRVWPAIKIQLPFTIAGVAGLAIFALANGYGLKMPNPEYLTYWGISVPAQEFIFRGYGQRVLRGALPTLANVFTVSLIFSLSHFFIGIPQVGIVMLTTLIAGFAWGWAYEKERNLVGPIFSHAVLGSLLFLILASG